MWQTTTALSTWDPRVPGKSICSIGVLLLVLASFLDPAQLHGGNMGTS